MGFGLSFRKNTNQVKLIREYIKARNKENQIINGQLRRINEQKRNKTIDLNTYERLRDLLEMNSIQKKEESFEKIFL